MAAKIRGIDDCIEALEDVADRLMSGTLTAADAITTVRSAQGHAELIGLKSEVLQLELDAGRMGIPSSTSEQGLGRELLELEEGMKQFRATLKRVTQILEAELRGKKSGETP